MADMHYGTNIEAVINDPNGFPGETRGGVAPTNQALPPGELGYVGHGPNPYPQNTDRPDPLLEAASMAVGPEG
jgi:hypothetical protein